MKNPHIELVKKWLADPKSVSQEELEANAYAAEAADEAADEADEAADYADETGYAARVAAYAYAAAYAAAAADGFEAANWVKEFEELTNVK